MKKNFYFVFAFLFMLFSFLLSSCESITSEKNDSHTYNVTFLNYDNSLLFRATNIKEGEPAIYEGDTPIRPNSTEYSYEFIGWDKDISAIYSDLVVFAKYNQIKNSNDNVNSDNDLNIDNIGESMLLNAYVSEVNSNPLELYNIGSFDNDFFVFYYDMGFIKRAPVYTSTAIEYGGQDLSLKLSFSKLSEESLESSISTVVEKIDSHSYTGGFNLGFQQDVEVGAKKLGTGLKAKFTTSQSTDHHWTNNWGNITTSSESTKNSYVSTYGEGFEISLDVSENKGFRKGYSYRISFYETIRCFAVLFYDIKSDEFTLSYETMLVPNQTRLVIEESTDLFGDFDYNITKNIDFDVDDAIRIAYDNMPEKDDKIHIKNYQEFYNYMNGDTADKYFILDLSVLDLQYVSWAPFKEFKGTLDGNGCEIINWNYKQVTTGNIGIFEANSGIIKNITLSKCNIFNEDPDVHGVLKSGILCGENNGEILNVNVKNCNINVDVGNISSPYNNYVYAGLICGQNSGKIYGDSEISNCEIIAYAGTEYKGSQTYIGCAVGLSISGLIDNIYSYNNKINATSKADVRYGGIFGTEDGHGRPYSYVGGIVGFCENTNLGASLRVSSNDLYYTLARDCNCSSNKGGGKGDIKGN